VHPKEISIKGFPFFFAIAIYCYEVGCHLSFLEEKKIVIPQATTQTKISSAGSVEVITTCSLE
jgi:hypothetical protein